MGAWYGRDLNNESAVGGASSGLWAWLEGPLQGEVWEGENDVGGAQRAVWFVGVARCCSGCGCGLWAWQNLGGAGVGVSWWGLGAVAGMGVTCAGHTR